MALASTDKENLIDSQLSEQWVENDPDLKIIRYPVSQYSREQLISHGVISAEECQAPGNCWRDGKTRISSDPLNRRL